MILEIHLEEQPLIPQVINIKFMALHDLTQNAAILS